jgi:hypothetical protein
MGRAKFFSIGSNFSHRDEHRGSRQSARNCDPPEREVFGSALSFHEMS